MMRIIDDDKGLAGNAFTFQLPDQVYTLAKANVPVVISLDDRYGGLPGIHRGGGGGLSGCLQGLVIIGRLLIAILKGAVHWAGDINSGLNACYPFRNYISINTVFGRGVLYSCYDQQTSFIGAGAGWADAQIPGAGAGCVCHPGSDDEGGAYPIPGRY